ncbi:MAG: hypothetical protein SNJ56_06175, partial [Termitinemataceae bacterium]
RTFLFSPKTRESNFSLKEKKERIIARKLIVKVCFQFVLDLSRYSGEVVKPLLLQPSRAACNRSASEA